MKIILISSLLILNSMIMKAQNTIFYIGTTDSELVESIVVGELDENEGTFKILSRQVGGVRPGYLALSSDNQFLYAVSAATFDDTENENLINAFAIENDPPELTHLNRQSSKGLNPTHVSVNPHHPYVYAANYGSGSVVSYRHNEDGSLSEPVSFFQHTGSGPNRDRQEGPHAHYIHASNNGEFVYACDLGTDRIMIYRQEGDGHLRPNEEQEYLELTPGSGPRHMDFHSNNQWVFILTELSNEILSCKINNESGRLDVIDKKRTIDENTTEKNKPAAVRIHPNGKYLYCSNRGVNSIVLFEIKSNGMLEKINSFTDGIGNVRDFNICPSGKYLIAGNQDEDELVLFKIEEDGSLKNTGNIIKTSKPTCVVFRP